MGAHVGTKEETNVDRTQDALGENAAPTAAGKSPAGEASCAGAADEAAPCAGPGTDPSCGATAESATSKLELIYGREGLARVAASTVVVLGLGGVGSNCVEALARGGVGRLVVVDHDVVQ